MKINTYAPTPRPVLMTATRLARLTPTQMHAFANDMALRGIPAFKGVA